MPRLRSLTGKEIVTLLRRFGFEVVRIRGSHHNMQRIIGDKIQNLTVPVHGNKSLPTATVRSIYRQAREFIPEDELRPHFYAD